MPALQPLAGVNLGKLTEASLPEIGRQFGGKASHNGAAFSRENCRGPPDRQGSEQAPEQTHRNFGRISRALRRAFHFGTGFSVAQTSGSQLAPHHDCHPERKRWALWPTTPESKKPYVRIVCFGHRLPTCATPARAWSSSWSAARCAVASGIFIYSSSKKAAANETARGHQSYGCSCQPSTARHIFKLQ